MINSMNKQILVVQVDWYINIILQYEIYGYKWLNIEALITVNVFLDSIAAVSLP